MTRRNTIDDIVGNHTIDDNGCWIHGTAPHIKDGYCRVRIVENGKSVKRLAHRLSYMYFNGDIPDDLLVCHECDVRNCINPDHLFVGTYADNIHDMIEKGRNVVLYGQDNNKAKLTTEQVLYIRSATETKAALARKFDVSWTAIHDIIKGKNYAWLLEDD